VTKPENSDFRRSKHWSRISSLEAVEFATLEWVDWFNHRRLLEPIGNIPPAEAEALYYAAQDNLILAACLKPNSLRESRGGSQPSAPCRGVPAMTKPVLQPGPDHPITIAPLGRRVTVVVAGQTIAESDRALVLREAAYPAVFYIPRQDARMELLERSEHSSYCPYKGDASYFSIPIGGLRSIDAVWTYEAPYQAVSEIKDHLAFYPDRVASITCG